MDKVSFADIATFADRVFQKIMERSFRIWTYEPFFCLGDPEKKNRVGKKVGILPGWKYGWNRFSLKIKKGLEFLLNP
ncbi:MAG: hypothetical protein ABIJ31_02575 [Pseudomonadota bacterium]